MLAPADFFDLSDEAVSLFFEGCSYAWEALQGLSTHVEQLVGDGQTILGEVMPGAYLGSAPLYIAPGARVEPGAYLHGPAYLGPGAVVRHGAFVRENVIMLDGSVLGHASEAKHSLFLPDAHAPHFAYVGDSILGRGVNLGAGTKLSNLTMVSHKDPVTGRRPTLRLHWEGQEYDTGLEKLGAILGDGSQTVQTPSSTLAVSSALAAWFTQIRPYAKGIIRPIPIIKLRQNTRLARRR